MGENGKRCSDMRVLLADCAFGEADDAAAGRIREHLATCGACRNYADELSASVRRLDAAPSIQPSEGFDRSLRIRLKQERRLEQPRGAVVLAVLAAGLRRLRRFELGAAVYPLAALSIAYVLWAMLTREPELHLTTSPYPGRPGVLRLWQPAERAETQRALVRMETLAADDAAWALEAADNPYQPEIAPEPPVLTRYATLPEMGHETPSEPPEVPPDWERLANLPDPPIVPLPAKVIEGPSGYALARARFATIRNANPLLSGAISRGILWLCRNQAPEGFWQAGESGAADYSQSEATAAAALAFMQAGFSPSGKDKPSRHLKLALTWLVRQRRDDGFFAPPGRRQLHAQALTVAALSEALRLTDREVCSARFPVLAREALSALVERRAPSGGWGDAELTAMAVMAMGAARSAGVPVENAAKDAAVAWLAAYRQRKSSGILASVDSRRPTPEQDATYAAIGEMLCTDEATWRSAASAEAAVTELAHAPVVWGAGDFFRWYGATLAAYRLDGRFWQGWRAELLVQLISHQEGWQRAAQNAAHAGSWEPHGVCRHAGRAYSTAMAVLALTATCGHSPLYGSVK